MKMCMVALSEQYGSPHAGYAHTINIAKALAEKNEVWLFMKGSNTREIKKEGKVYIGLIDSLNIKGMRNPRGFVNDYYDFKELLAEFEVVHERYSVNPVTTFFKRKGQPYILEVNDAGVETWQGLRKIIYSPLIKTKLQRADALITQTETLKRILSKQTKKPIYVVPNAVDYEKFHKLNKKHIAEQREKTCPATEHLIGYVGSFREWHGVRFLPFIVQDMLKQHSDTKVLMVGDGKERCEFEKLATKLGVLDKFVMAGSQPHEKIPEYMAMCDVLIAPFANDWGGMRKHGFWWNPMKLWEFLSVGKPIVTSRIPEVMNVVGDCAMLVHPADFKGYESALFSLFEDKKLCKRMGKRAQARAKKNTWKHRARSIEKIYKRVNRKC